MSNKINYVDPKVKLIFGSRTNNGFYVWLKSREEIIHDVDGNKFIKKLKYSNNWIDKLPDTFYVGGELVNKNDYRDRIIAMDLQYNSFDYYIFEIDGSCLFRDILFNIETVKKWATSNRFKFNLLSGDNLRNYSNYPVSSEYKGLPEWENALHEYIKVAGNDDRSMMPLSISSHFWVGIDYKLLTNFLSLLKHNMPFYYEVYGKQFMECLGITEHDLPINISPDLTRYYLKDPNWEIDRLDFDNIIYFKTDMALILYSQFLRQSACTITGYYNIMDHSNIEEFKNKVFLGKTTIDIGCLTSKDKMMQTISNRCCAFSMNKGNGNDSWNHIISMFLKTYTSAKEFMDILPCKFTKSYKHLLECKFHEDIKFRNEGKEVVACPCPIYNNSLELAIRKHKEDNNVLSHLYVKTMEYMTKSHMRVVYENNFFTSDLKIYTDVSDTLAVDETYIEYLVDYIDTRFSKFRSEHEMDTDALYHWFSIDMLERLDDYIGRTKDYTCCLKGLFLDALEKNMEKTHKRFIIDFGGDIKGHNTGVVKTLIKDTNIYIITQGNWTICCSGNDDERRGEHIETKTPGVARGIVVTYNQNPEYDTHSTRTDYLATKIVEDINYPLMFNGCRLNRHAFIRLDKDHKIINSTYCASPFFNPRQVEVRDKMISKFTNVFRPDLTDSSKVYDSTENPDKSIIDSVVDDNIKGIKECTTLVYPSNTNDLGTLFEVGNALMMDKTVIKYDEYMDTYTVIPPNPDRYKDLKYDKYKNYKFDCSNKVQAISMGVASAAGCKNIYYELNGAKDNIMLSNKYTHIEKIDNKYQIIERDGNDRDK